MEERKKVPTSLDKAKDGLREIEAGLIELQGLVGDGPASQRIKLLKPKIDRVQRHMDAVKEAAEAA